MAYLWCIQMHYFQAPIHEATGPGDKGIIPTKYFEILSMKPCILAPSGLRSGAKQNKTNPGELDVKMILDVTLKKYGQHCSIAPKIGEGSR